MEETNPKEITRKEAILLMVQYAHTPGWFQFSNDELQEMLIENGNNIKIVD